MPINIIILSVLVSFRKKKTDSITVRKMQKVVGDKFLLTVGRQMEYAVLRK
ncbi:MAG: hypothetical protein IJD40_01290 [Lachnospiraceae bacterium]|nr:hypothetical protein [Lachnospiraceae bacterium]